MYTSTFVSFRHVNLKENMSINKYNNGVLLQAVGAFISPEHYSTSG
jgi:hypothetical protein